MPADAAVSYVANVLRQYEALRQDGKPSDPETAAMVAAPRAGRPSPRGVGSDLHSLLDSAFRVHYDSARLFEADPPAPAAQSPGERRAGQTNVTDVVVAAEDGGVTVIAG